MGVSPQVILTSTTKREDIKKTPQQYRLRYHQGVPDLRISQPPKEPLSSFGQIKSRSITYHSSVGQTCGTFAVPIINFCSN